MLDSYRWAGIWYEQTRMNVVVGGVFLACRKFSKISCKPLQPHWEGISLILLSLRITKKDYYR